jgi:hypothetical protein
MAVVDDLAGLEGADGQLHAIDDGVEAALQQTDQVFRGVATAAHGLVIQLAELLFRNVAVIALQLLLGHQLGAEIGRLLAAGAVLAGRGFLTARQRALATAPQIDAQAAVDFEFRFNTLSHGSSFGPGYCRLGFVPIGLIQFDLGRDASAPTFSGMNGGFYTAGRALSMVAM